MNLPASNATALIRARGLTKTFGDRTAVAGIDFEVLDGEFFGFLGPNGAGKTTTLRTIATASVSIVRPSRRRCAPSEVGQSGW